MQLQVPIATWRFAADGQSILTIDNGGRVARRRGRGFRDESTVMNLELTPGDWRINTLLPEQISPNLRLVAVQRNEGKVEVWDVTTGRRHHEFNVAANTYPLAVFLDDRTLRVFDERKSDSIVCREWDLESGRETRLWRMAIRGSGVLLVAFSSDAKRCLTTSAAGTYVHDLETGGTMPAKIAFGARFPRFSPDGAFVAVSLMGSQALRLWDTTDYRDVATLSVVPSVPHSVAFTPDGSRVVSAGGGRGGMMLWSVSSHEPVLALDTNGAMFLGTGFSPDGTYLASRSTLLPEGNGILHLWRAPSWKEIEQAEATATTVAQNP